MPWNVKQHVEDFRRGFRTEGSFTQNLAITFSGNVMAQVIGFAFTPFIARIYGPEAYGVFALFIAIVNNLYPLSTWQFPSGYVAAKNDEEFYRIVQITLIVLFGGTILYSLFIFTYQKDFAVIFSMQELTLYFYWMPLYFFLMGLDHIFQGWNIRMKEFKRGAAAKILSTATGKGATILFGLLLQPTALGIIIGNLLIYPLEIIIKFGPKIRNGLLSVLVFSPWKTLRKTIVVFKGYPLFVTPGLLVNNLSSQLPIYYFSLTINNATVGMFALANSVVNMPLALIINSSTTVFLQKAAETILRSQSELKELVGSLYKKLFIISSLPLITLAFTSEWLFRVVFGSSWEQSGQFASLLCLSALFGVTCSPLSVLYRLMHQERINFILNTLFMGIKFLGLWIGLYYDSIMLSVIGYSLASLLSYMISLYFIFKMVRLSPWILVRDFIIVGIIAVVVIGFNV